MNDKECKFKSRHIPVVSKYMKNMHVIRGNGSDRTCKQIYRLSIDHFLNEQLSNYEEKIFAFRLSIFLTVALRI